jgi:hypothetical protein
MPRVDCLQSVRDYKVDGTRIDRAHWAALRRYADEGGTSFAGVSHFDSIKLFSS